jgi:hypothetical protein
MDIIIPGGYYLIPGNIEYLMDYANHCNNFGLFGLYMGVRNRRNMLYVSEGIALLFFIYNYKVISLLFFTINMLQLNSYLMYLSAYRKYF